MVGNTTFKKAPFFITILLLLLVFSLSTVLFTQNYPGVRRIFIFESLDDVFLHYERRTMQAPAPDSTDSLYSQYVGELLLGAVSDRYRPLFPRGTVCTDCFLRDKVLYVNLSSQALLPQGTSSDTATACSLFKKNLRVNFPAVKKVVLFIEGVEAYPEGLILDGA